MKHTSVIAELEHLGLSERESKVYLASLLLGPSTAQLIAAKAGITRPTTYLAIEFLVKLGLMTSFQKGKKRYFALENPTALKTIVEREEAKIKERKDKVDGLVKQLSTLDEKSSVLPVAIAERDDSNSFADDLGKGEMIAVLSHECTEDVQGLLDHVIGRGNAVRVLTFGDVKLTANPKMQVRKMSRENGKMGAFIASNKAMVMFMADAGPLRALVRDHSVVRLMHELFENSWKQAK